uniref:Uncharacterized protein n=1 Tax=Solanum lycopersicum TaxID=4081 RepID=A0A3Q7HUY3_SOLLC
MDSNFVVSQASPGSEGRSSPGKSAFIFFAIMRLDPEEISAKLTGYERKHDAVTCIGMRTYIPDEAITNLKPDFFWFGVDEIDLKLGIRIPQFH